MDRYFFIPIKYEQELTLALNDWNQNKEFSILTGVYRKSLTYTDGVSTVISRNILGENVTFDYSYHEGEEFYTLIGWCLEGYLQEVAPDYYAYICTLSDIQKFETNIEYLEYIKTIIN
jgi:hypothetical protein